MSANTEHGRALAALGSDYASAISRIYERQGDAAADAQRERGKIWGDAATSIGKIASEGVTQAYEAHQENRINDIFKKYGTDFEQALPEVMQVNPKLARKIAEQVHEQQKWAYEMKDLDWKASGRKLLMLDEKLASVKDQATWTAALYAGKQAGIDVSGYSPIYDPGTIAQLRKNTQAAYQAHQGQIPELPKPFTLGGEQIRFDEDNTPVAYGANVGPNATPKMPDYGSDAYRVMTEENNLRAQQGLPPLGAPSASAASPAPAPPRSLTLNQVEGRGTPPTPIGPGPSQAMGTSGTALAAGAASGEGEQTSPPPAMTPAQVTLEAYQRRDAAKKKETPVSYQSKTVLLDGKPALVGFNPQTNTYHKGDQDVTARVKDVPSQGPDPLLHELRQMQIDAAKQAATSGGNWTPKQVATFNQIAGAYDRSPLVKAGDRTIVLKDAIKAVQTDPKNPTNQLNLAYAYVAALDTYQSSVREGELKNLGMLGTKLQQLGVTVDRLVSSGAFIPPGLARDIASSGEQLVKTIEAGRQQKQREFASRAKVSGVGEMWEQFVGGFQPPPTDTAAPKATHRFNPATGKLEPVK